MILETRLQAAAAKAKVKQSLRDRLNDVPVEERTGLLIDLLMEMDPAIFSDVHPAVVKETVLNIGPVINGHSPVRRRHRIRRSKGGLSETIIRMLREKPGRKIAEISEVIYRDTGRQAQSKTRSLMNSLVRKSLIRRIPGGDPGQWEVLP